MKRMLTATVLVAMACAMPATVSAKSKFYNATTRQVDVDWIALGCFGASLQCGWKENLAVCKQVSLSPGESGSYSFQPSTFTQELIASKCNDDQSDISDTSNDKKNRRCAAIIRTNNIFATECGYSKEEYRQLKKEPLQRPLRRGRRAR